VHEHLHEHVHAYVHEHVDEHGHVDEGNWRLATGDWQL